MGEEMSDQAGFLIIGERINATRRQIREALARRDADLIRKEAQKQAAAGAHYIDVNAGANPATEAEDMKWLVEVVQSAVDLPLCLDSPSPDVLHGALSLAKKEPMINSITPEPARMKGILPLAVEHGCTVVGLCIGESGLPQGVEARLSAAAAMARSAESVGLPLSRIYFDPAVAPVSTCPQEAVAAIDSIRLIKSQFPGARTTCGLSNVSFGLPERMAMNAVFLAMMMGAGLDSAIIDITDRRMRAAILAAEALLARDEYCMRYIRAAREGLLEQGCSHEM